MNSDKVKIDSTLLNMGYWDIINSSLKVFIVKLSGRKYQAWVMATFFFAFGIGNISAWEWLGFTAVFAGLVVGDKWINGG